MEREEEDMEERRINSLACLYSPTGKTHLGTGEVSVRKHAHSRTRNSTIKLDIQNLCIKTTTKNKSAIKRKRARLVQSMMNALHCNYSV